MKKIFLFLTTLLLAVTANAQVDPNAPLQRDPNLLYGKLDNGMTYYIMHNDLPAQRAEFYLLNEIGAIQETPAQNGLAHFQEHMCLNGTKNFPGKGIISFMESIGASFGGNVNASTGQEYTIYMFTNIPVTRESIIDSTLLAIHDYAAFVTNDPVEIDKERGVIIEEWRTRRTADWRMMEKTWETLYRGSKFENCNIIGTKENLETFPAEELVKFYQTWYRPDLQAVVVIGDIDPQQVLEKVKATFADIPARENPEPKGVYRTPDNEEPIVGIFTDPEARSTQVTAYVKSDPLPKAYLSYGVGYMMDLVKDIINSMFSERLTDIAHQPDAPFLYANAYWTRENAFMDAFEMSATTKDGEAEKGFAALLTEVEKAQRYGFTQAEYDRVKTNMIANAERNTSNASTRKSPSLVYEAMTDFLYGFPMMAPEYVESQLKGYLAMITIDQINQIVASTDYTKNLVIIYQAPEKEGLTHPTEETLKGIVTAVKAADIQANEAEEEMGELLDASKLKGSKTRKETGGLYGSTVWTLRNGIRVTIRPSQYNKEEVLFKLSVPGGQSLIEDADIASMDNNVLMLYNQLCGLSEFPATKLNKMLTGRIVSENPFIDDLHHGINGSCAPKDFETLMQLVYLQVTAPRFNADEFAPGMAQLNAIVPNLEKQPNYILSKTYLETAYGNNPRQSLISMEKVGKISLESFERSYRKLFANMAGADVIITGNFDPTTVKPLVEKYIGSLPTKKAGKWIDRKVDLVPGKVENIFTTKMDTPKTSCLMIASGKMAADPKSRLIMSALEGCLNQLYTETVREDEGGTYGVGCQGTLVSIPKEEGQIFIQFDTDPDRAEKLIALTYDGLKSMAVTGPSEVFLNKTKENLLKTIPERRINNSYWSSCLMNYYNTGNDLDANREELISSITVEDVRAFTAKLLDQGNLIKIVMNPEK